MATATEQPAATLDIDRTYGLGEFNSNAKLCADDVREIVRRVMNGEQQVDVAAVFGVTYSTVSHIMGGRNWRSITRRVPGFVPSPHYHRRGEQHHHHRLTEQDVIDIHARLCARHTLTAIAADYGVSNSIIRSIAHGETWRHITNRLPPIPAPATSVKLTEAQVIDIRRKRAAGHTIKGLAREFGVGKSTIDCIVHHRTWKAVGGALAN